MRGLKRFVIGITTARHELIRCGKFAGFIERGDSVPALTANLEIAPALNVRPAELFRDS